MKKWDGVDLLRLTMRIAHGTRYKVQGQRLIDCGIRIAECGIQNTKKEKNQGQRMLYRFVGLIRLIG